MIQIYKDTAEKRICPMIVFKNIIFTQKIIKMCKGMQRFPPVVVDAQVFLKKLKGCSSDGCGRNKYTLIH